VINILKRVLNFLELLFFDLLVRGTFKFCGKKTLLYSPYRLEGQKNICIGSNTTMQKGGWLSCYPAVSNGKATLTIGSGCVLGYNNHIISAQSVTIEDHVLTANNVYISDNSHSYVDIMKPIMFQGVTVRGPVVIGSGTWLGENVCVVGASIGKNCVIGSNSVVTRNIPDFSVAVGAPAKVIKKFSHADGVWIEAKGDSDD
jgi:acetyltransferase-like isoleucine patch superfamily enzyme